MTAQLAMYKGKGSVANAVIRWWTGSVYSHCELVVGGICYSSSVMDGGVRQKAIDLDSGNWDVFDLPWADASLVLEYFESTRHHRYGWPGLILNQLFNLNRAVPDRQFCSEWCGRALGLPNPSSLSPVTLWEWCGYLTEKGKMTEGAAV